LRSEKEEIIVAIPEVIARITHREPLGSNVGHINKGKRLLVKRGKQAAPLQISQAAFLVNATIFILRRTMDNFNNSRSWLRFSVTKEMEQMMLK
jgi:hypothetical protein